MNNFLNKIPVSPITSFGNPSVPNGSTFGTNFSILQTGGYMEVYTLSGLTYTIPPATTGIIEFSGNSIPIQFTKGSGSAFSPDVLTLNSDNISSGRRKLGMLAYVYETNKIYQFRIDNYDTLWNNATGATGLGGPTVVISDYGTTVKNNSAAGIAFINAWTASTISGVDGYNDTNSSWRVLSTGGSGGGGTSITGGTFNHGTETLSLYDSTGGTITITGFTDVYVTGATKSGSVATFTNNSGGTFNLTGLTDTFVTGGTKSGNNAVFTNNTGGTFTVTGFTDTFVTGATYSNNTFTYRNNTGGTFSVFFNTMTGLTATTISATTYQNLPIDIRVTGGTYSSDGTLTFRNNTGGTFNVTGLYTGGTDIYVNGGTINNGPGNDNNKIVLNRTDGNTVTLDNLVEIVDVTKSEMDTLISGRNVIRGKTYKISNCDNSLYYYGTDRDEADVYTTIYLLGLEEDKLSESGIGIFYTPRYTTAELIIFFDGIIASNSRYYIWGGFVWLYKGEEAPRNSIDIFTLPESFEIKYPFVEGNDTNLKDFYNEQYDDIIYDYTNDRIIYRNEQNSNIVSTTYENITYWITEKGFYNPIRVFQWGHLVNFSGGSVIYNQQIINSYNENINYLGQYQKDFYFNNLSYQRDLFVYSDSYQNNFIFDNQSFQNDITISGGSYQSGIFLNNSSYQEQIKLDTNSYQNQITLNNNSYQDRINLLGVIGTPSSQNYFNFNNNSYQDTISLTTESIRTGIQSYFNFDNHSYQSNVSLTARQQYYFDFTNESGQDNIYNSTQTSLIFDSAIQSNYLGGGGQNNITIKGYSRDLTSVDTEQDEYYIHDLPSDNTAPVYIGKINNRLVQVTKPTDIFVTGGTYNSGTSTITFTNNSGGTFNVTGISSGGGGTFTGGTVTGPTTFTNGLTANTISATTYFNLPTDIRVTGGTYTNGVVTFRNNTGGTFNVTGLTTPFTGGTVTGATNFTGGLSANTISATTYFNLPTDIRVTGGTYSNGSVTFTNNTGGTFNVTGLTTPFTGGTVSGATNFTGGLSANTISATTYFNLPKLQNVVTVAKSGGDFTSIKSAVDSITDSSSNNRYVIRVAPGNYMEDTIDLQGKEFISIVGFDILEVLVIANNPSQTIFNLGNNNELSFMTISGATSGIAIYCYDSDGFSLVHKISIYDCDTNVYVRSNTSNTNFYGEYMDFNGSYTYGTRVLSEAGNTAYANIENYYNFPIGSNPTIANSVQGSGATLSVFVGDGIGNGVSGSTNYQLSDYASLNTISTTADNWDYGVRVLNVGGPSRFDIDSLSIVNSIVYDLSIEHPGTFGTFGGGSATHTKINNLSDSVYWAFLDTLDGEFEVTRKISVTFDKDTHTDASTLIFKGGTMGLMTGGTISVVSGLTVNVSSGFGYLQKTTSEGVYMRVDWVGSNLILPQNINYYLYFNENEILSTSGTRPDSVNNIVLGRVVTNSSTVSFIDESPMNADHTSNRFGSLFREALGPIYAFGSIVTQGTTPFTLNVSSGEYYYSTNEYQPTGGSGLTFNQYYRNGSGGWIISATTLVNNTQFDNNGTLSGLTSSAYTKHTLYLVGDGVNEKYFLVLGQNQYQTLVETENALLPEPPSYFTDSVTQLANIYIRQGLSGITQIEDIRPVIGFKAGGVNASSLHANLLGLTSDDHKQYLLVDGSRAMSNNLDMGGNAIVSAGTINGVTIQSHASRHKNGGADEISTDIPGPSEIPKADTSGKLDGWISDSSSTVKGLVTLSTDPTLSTSPIALGVNDDRFLKSFTGLSYSNNVFTYRTVDDTVGSFLVNTMTGLTATTISATTYQNLPQDIFVTGGTYDTGTSTITFRNNSGGTFNVSGITSSGGGSFTGGTVSGATIFTGGLTANTISATTITSPSISPYGLIVATSLGYQNIF